MSSSLVFILNMFVKLFKEVYTISRYDWRKGISTASRN